MTLLWDGWEISSWEKTFVWQVPLGHTFLAVSLEIFVFYSQLANTEHGGSILTCRGVRLQQHKEKQEKLFALLLFATVTPLHISFSVRQIA